jgi:hypothetical protein
VITFDLCPRLDLTWLNQLKMGSPDVRSHDLLFRLYLAPILVLIHTHLRASCADSILSSLKQYTLFFTRPL